MMDDLEINRTETLIAHQRVSIIDLILPEQLEGRLQVLPQQVDLGWCEHSRCCRGGELGPGKELQAEFEILLAPFLNIWPMFLDSRICASA